MGAELLDVLKTLLSQQLAEQLPHERFSAERGFTWMDALRSVDSQEGDKEALCVQSRTGTIFTRQVLGKEDECACWLQVVNAGGEDGQPIFLGIVEDIPVGFDNLAIGHREFKNSIGICAYPGGGEIVHAGETKGSIPGIEDGDIVKVQVSKGSQISFMHRGQNVLSFQVNGDGKFRLAATLSSERQKVKIHDVDPGWGPGLQVSRRPGFPKTLQSGTLPGRFAVASAAGFDERQQEALKGILALAEAIGAAALEDGASQLPMETYSPLKGFTWVDTLRSVNCESQDKVAKCVIARMATMVTAQVLTSQDECDFVMRVRHAGADDQPLMFGVVDVVPVGFSRLPIGHVELKNSLGACCLKEAGQVVTRGEYSSACPGISDGDVLKAGG